MHGTAVREQAGEIITRHFRPMADRTGVEVDEMVRRTRIEADAAALQLQADLADPGHGNAGDEEIHRPALDMLRMLRHCARTAAQHGIGAFRPEGRQHVDRCLAADAAIDLPQKVEKARIHPGRLVGAPVAQEPVQPVQRFLVIAAVALEGDEQFFAGMPMHEGQSARIAIGHHGLRLPADQHQEPEPRCRCRYTPQQTLRYEAGKGSDLLFHDVFWALSADERPNSPPGQPGKW